MTSLERNKCVAAFDGDASGIGDPDFKNRWNVAVTVKNGDMSTKDPMTGLRWYNPLTKTYRATIQSTPSGCYNYAAKKNLDEDGTDDTRQTVIKKDADTFFTRNELQFVNNEYLKIVSTGEILTYTVSLDFASVSGTDTQNIARNGLLKKDEFIVITPKEELIILLNSLKPEDMNNDTLKNLIERYKNDRDALEVLEKKFGVSIIDRN